MLTPEIVKQKSFQTTGRGSYRAEDVDSFFFEVATSYEQMYRENAELIKKITILAKKVEEYRADEDSLKMALLRAQKLADSIVAEAKEAAENEVASIKGEVDKLRADAAADAAALELNAKNESEALLANAKKEADEILANANMEADKLINDANAQSKDILGNINRKVTHESLVYEMLQKESTVFKQRLVSMYKEHINLINKLPEIVEEQLDNEENEAAEIQEPVVAAPVEETAEVETVVEVESNFDDEEDFVVIAEPEEFVEEIIEDEEVVEEPVVVEQEEKGAFKFNFDKVEFEEDDEPVPVVAPFIENFEVIADDENSEDDDDTEMMSFRNFFKKK